MIGCPCIGFTKVQFSSAPKWRNFLRIPFPGHQGPCAKSELPGVRPISSGKPNPGGGTPTWTPSPLRRHSVRPHSGSRTWTWHHASHAWACRAVWFATRVLETARGDRHVEITVGICLDRKCAVGGQLLLFGISTQWTLYDIRWYSHGRRSLKLLPMTIQLVLCQHLPCVRGILELLSLLMVALFEKEQIIFTVFEEPSISGVPSRWLARCIWIAQACPGLWHAVHPKSRWTNIWFDAMPGVPSLGGAINILYCNIIYI